MKTGAEFRGNPLGSSSEVPADQTQRAARSGARQKARPGGQTPWQGRANPTRPPWKSASINPRLCWTRGDLVHATGLSYRTIQNLEARGLLRRCALGIKVACYTPASVRALFGPQPDDPAPASPAPRQSAL